MPGSMTSSTTRSTPGLQGVLQPAVAFVLALHGEAFAVQEFAQQPAEFRVIIDQKDVHTRYVP